MHLLCNVLRAPFRTFGSYRNPPPIHPSSFPDSHTVPTVSRAFFREAKRHVTVLRNDCRGSQGYLGNDEGPRMGRGGEIKARRIGGSASARDRRMLFHRGCNVSQAFPAATSNLYGCHLGSIVVVQRYSLYTRIVAGSRVRLQF